MTAGWGCMHWSAEIAALQTPTLQCVPQQHQQPSPCFGCVGRRQGPAAGAACPPQWDISKEKVLQDFICHVKGPATSSG